MDSFQELSRGYSKKDSEENNYPQESDEEKSLDALEKKIKDLELQLEYEINQHNIEISERDETIRKLEERVDELENSKNIEEKDEAILNMSEKLLILSNKYDILVKESKLQEEELKHLKNKKKYRNDKTNEFIMALKKQNEEFKKDYDVLSEKYSQLLKDYEGLKKIHNSLQEQFDENKKKMEIIRREKINEGIDENSALKILSLRNDLIHKKNSNNKGDMDELSTLKLELEYKEMMIQKLIKKNLNEARINKQETNYNDLIINNEKKIDELYNKYLDAQSDNDKLKKQINILNNDIKHLKEENSALLTIANKLRDAKREGYKDELHINQFDDLLNHLLKENSTLNEEISKQKKKNMADAYYFNKELQMIKNNKFKIIEKFDNKKINKIPHLFQPVNLTLNMKDEKSDYSEDNKDFKKDHDIYKDDTNLMNPRCKLEKPIITDKLVHIYIQDYMEKVQNKK